MEVAIIGAGITGVTTAYYLAKQGHSVVVFEKESYAGMMTSYANGGQLSASNAETWNTWSNVKKGMKWMFNPSAPLLIRPTPTLSKISWMAGFLRETMKGDRWHRRCTWDTIDMSLIAREEYYKIAEETGIPFNLSKNGILHFYKNEQYFNDACTSVHDLFNFSKLTRKIITAEQVKEIEPKLRDVRGIVGGTWTESDAMGDIHKFCNNLALYMELNMNVKFIYNIELESSFSDDWDTYYDAVVICAGAHSSKVASWFGESINVYPVKGYSITIKGNPDTYPKTSLLDDETKIVTSTLGDRFRVAGTAELDGWNLDIRKSRIDPLVNWVKQNFPDIDTRDYKPWAGLRPMTPSMMPIVRESRTLGVYLNTGHGHLGWTLAPATALEVSRLIEEDYGNTFI